MKNEKLSWYRSIYFWLAAARQQLFVLVPLGIFIGYAFWQSDERSLVTFNMAAYHDEVRAWDCSLYFDRSFLSRYGQVKKQLTHDGFKNGYFVTSDGINIEYLFLKRPAARCTVIACCGWLPGRKEGLASLYKLLPDYCNILFFDARGHGGSSGSFIKSLCSYGQTEYEDILAAIHFVRKKSKRPIILFGTCAGAFHAVHALAALERNKENDVVVHGLIFDSGWASLKKTAHSVPHARVRDIYTNLVGYFFEKQNNMHTLLVDSFSAITGLFIDGLHACYCSLIDEERTNLFGCIEHISVPILFIHAQDDAYVSIDEVKRLANKTKHKVCWWIDEPSYHACNHLKHKHTYRQKIGDFIENLLKSLN